MVRPARSHDLPAIAAIYTAGIEGRTATFETRPRGADDVAPWLEQPDRFPVLVSDDDDEVLGFARVGPYTDFEPYRGVGELMIYVAPAARRRGIALELVEAVCRALEERGYWKVLGKLFIENEPSRALLRRCGFRDVGVHHRHGRLDGDWRDVVVVERLLGEAAR
jgi:L-amino acid N-acyltransferase YncA